MTSKVKMLMILSLVKYYSLKYILPIYFLIKIINEVGNEDFYQSVIKYSAYIIISLVVNRIFMVEILLSKKDKEWIENEINRLQ